MVFLESPGLQPQYIATSAHHDAIASVLYQASFGTFTIPTGEHPRPSGMESCDIA